MSLNSHATIAEIHRAQTLQSFEEFLTRPLEERLQRALQTDAEANVLALLHRVVATVPAYSQHLASHGIAPERIQSFEQFQSLPLLTKDNYLLRYPLKARCRDGQLSRCDMIALSSGSTGKPTPWPRSLSDELQIATRFEQIFLDSFRADRTATLAVVCFSLGTWVGGMFTASCCRYLAAKGYPITVITPGNHPDEILRLITELGPAFEQVVLLGYPPFLKAVVDTGRAQGIAWPDYSPKLVMAGEVFSEEWRGLVGERLGSQHPCYDSASLYGTADAGVLGNETPLSIAIRRFLANHPAAARSLFGESRLPTLVQYDPTSRFFEAIERSLIFSGDNGIPLLRYNIRDTGGVIGYPQMLSFLQDYGFDPVAQLRTEENLPAQAVPAGVRPFPFVYVFGRSDFTVSYFGANIYPENITVGLEQPEVREWVTGKFVMQVIETADHNQRLSVVVEMAAEAERALERAENSRAARQTIVERAILTQLLRLNSEFASYVPPEYQLPLVSLAPAGDPDYFPPGVKHRYSRP